MTQEARLELAGQMEDQGVPCHCSFVGVTGEWLSQVLLTHVLRSPAMAPST